MTAGGRDRDDGVGIRERLAPEHSKPRAVDARAQTGKVANGFGVPIDKSGYTSAVTVQSGIDTSPNPEPLQLKRVKIGGKESLRDFALRMRTGMRAWNK